MARELVNDGVRSFASGLDTSSDEASVADNALRRAENARLVDRGAVTKRLGTQRLHAAALPATVRGVFAWRRATGQTLLAVSNGLLHTASYSVGLSWAAQVGALSTSATPSFAPFRDASGEACYLADGGPLNKWNGTALSVNLAGTPNVAFVWVYNQRLYGLSQDSETLYYSALNDGDTLGVAASGGGSVVIRTFGASKLMAGAALGPDNLLLHAGGLSVFTGYTQDDIAITAGTRGVSPLVGAPAPWGVIPLEGALWVPTERGVFLVSGAGAQALDTPERPDPTAPLFAALSASDLLRVRAVLHRATKEVLTYIPGQGVYVWHSVLQAWTGPWNGGYLAPDTTALCEAVDGDGKPVVLRGDASGWVSRCDATGITSDNATSAGVAGTAITASISPRRFYVTRNGQRDLMGSFALRRFYVHADLKGSNATSVRYATPYDANGYTISGTGGALYYDGAQTWDSGAAYDGAGMRPYEVPAGGNGPWVDVTIEDSGASASIISAIEVEGYMLGWRVR